MYRDADIDGLIALVTHDPQLALDTALDHAVEADSSDLRRLADLNRVIGLAERDLGNLGAARNALELAADQAHRWGDPQLAAGIRSQLAYVIARLGDLETSIEVLREAETHLDGFERARLMNDLGGVLYWRGELEEAAAVIERASDELAEHDALSEAKARTTLGAVLSQLARYADARRHLERAAEVANEVGDRGIGANVQHNLGFLAMLQGELPVALEHFESAERSSVEAGVLTYIPRLQADHAQALADAALFEDADGLVRAAIEAYRRQGQETELAGTLLTAAQIRLAQHDLTGAKEAARDAGQRFASQRRPSWVAVARFLELQACARELDDDDPYATDLAIELNELGDELARHGWGAESIRCRLTAARLQADSAAPTVALSAALRHDARRARASDRILLAHVDALNAIKVGNRRAARRAISTGVETAMSSQAALGSIETRAHAAVHGSALTVMGARLAIEDKRPRELLMRIEATRLLTSRLPDVRPPEDPAMAAMLTELRNLTSTIADPSSTDEQRREASHTRARIERDVRRRSRTARGDTNATVHVREELGTALALLGNRNLLAHAALDERLYAVSVVRGRARLHDLGSLGVVGDQLDGIAFALHRLNRTQGSEQSRVAAAEMLHAMADELADLLVPAVVADSMDPVVVVPTAVLHNVPWALLPPLGGRAVSVNPSVSAWARAERTRRERVDARRGSPSVGFMAGPGLEFAELEVQHLAAIHEGSEVYTGRAATGAACVDLLRRADLVHVACHGQFRVDNPMFSALHLADGPLFVHDLERLDRLPETVVLPACSVADTKALQGGALLGLAAALITLGAANVIAPLTPINDAASVTVMQRLHQALITGATPAEALAAAAMSHDLADPTAAAFITLGA